MTESPLQPKPPRISFVEMTELVLPNDANIVGNMMGGRVLHFIDLAGALAAIRHSGKLCVTASFDSVDFLSPIHIGEACLLRAKVTWAGHTSIETKVDVYAENLLTGERRHTTTAFTTFVALDPTTSKPTPVPPVRTETAEEELLFTGAVQRRADRLARRRAIPPSGATPTA